MIKGVHHLAVSTQHLQALKQFYCEVLGFEPGMEAEWRADTEFGRQADRFIGHANSAAKVTRVCKGGLIVELFEYRSPAPRKKSPDWKVSDHGYTHICLEVEDIAAEHQRLSQSGMSFHAPPPKYFVNGMKAIYGRDPEGNVIELLELCEQAEDCSSLFSGNKRVVV